MKTAGLLALLTTLQLMAGDNPSLDLIAEVKGFSHPESVAWDGSFYYVSDIGKEMKPTDKDGDGSIFRMDAKGEKLEADFITKLNAPKGLLVIKNTLYVCDIDTLLGFDLETKKKTFEVSFAKDGVTFLNDVCSAGDGKLFVSATDKNKIYLVDVVGKSAKEVTLDKAPNGPNGLVFWKEENDAYLVVVEWGGENKPNGIIKGYNLDETLLKGTYDAMPEDSRLKSGYLDGVALMSNTKGATTGLLYSDWVDFKPVGKLFCLSRGESDQMQITSLDIPKGPPGGPADFFYDPKTSNIALPCMLEGRVLLLHLNSPKNSE